MNIAGNLIGNCLLILVLSAAGLFSQTISDSIFDAAHQLFQVRSADGIVFDLDGNAVEVDTFCILDDEQRKPLRSSIWHFLGFPDGETIPVEIYIFRGAQNSLEVRVMTAGEGCNVEKIQEQIKAKFEAPKTPKGNVVWVLRDNIFVLQCIPMEKKNLGYKLKEDAK